MSLRPCPDPSGAAPAAPARGPILTPLQHHRQAPADTTGAHTALDLRVFGPTEPGTVAQPALLQPAAEVTERWCSDTAAALQAGRHGCTSWRSDGCWLWVRAVIDERQVDGGLQEAARRLYGDLFTLLRQQADRLGRALHVVKVWNYLADINGTDPLHGLERYRLFNIGRQDAFLDAGQSAFAGAPAACALGTHRGPLTVWLLAGPVASRVVENPRQTSAYHYPGDYGPRAPTFSRAALADAGGGRELLVISGTASIVGHLTRHAGDVERQTGETLDNLEAVLGAAAPAARARHGLDTLVLTVYLRHARDLPVVQRVLADRLGADSPALRGALFLLADVCRADLLVEIEAHSLQACSPMSIPTPA
ncbi:enamine deaminase RidA (YjgF/YER057c/UK114 family) [Sphaerotilus hippei]|uniref:Enamine deaminase RidA (YjgF/YER057c/UK114 family) n=1 Tax=Sphaerotilus hippei TaxID=744406 RepID=A0A318H985_9BURK|nr:hypothetical protein [Sphaerotilus hippei]PXW96647.1 enamine deaminase RidA (YjgF/YER057c/UK114 family) [Sphaerotilus hippei]